MDHASSLKNESPSKNVEHKMPQKSGRFSGIAELHGKPVRIEITERAVRALASYSSPIIAEMQLYFSCLVRKQVLFSEFDAATVQHGLLTTVFPGLYLRFQAVTTAQCRISDVDGKPPLQAMPIKKPEQFVPSWLKIDFRKDQWRGEYGYLSSL